MGISVSAGTAVILVGLFLMLGVIVPGALNAHDRVNTASEKADELTLNQQETDIEIESATKGDGTLEIVVENTGTNTLTISRTSTLVNNEVLPPTETVITDTDNNQTDLWLPDETLQIIIDADDHSSGIGQLHDAKVITEYGVADRQHLEEED